MTKSTLDHLNNMCNSTCYNRESFKSKGLEGVVMNSLYITNIDYENNNNNSLLNVLRYVSPRPVYDWEILLFLNVLTVLHTISNFQQYTTMDSA